MNTKFTDAILYVPDFAQLVAYMDEHHPDCLVRDEEGNIVQPPVITGFARTPAVVNGNSLMVYARLRPEQVEQWQNVPGVEILGQAEYVGRETPSVVYDQVFADETAKAKYESVYSLEPKEYTDEETGETYIETPSEKFGTLAS